ncbi:unnamed protein product [Kuraishia capsulata CBS 1993]|uniref:CSC1/OSCA1-like 7TM region domain-containing protein n=1 Tax=Kuraishia capsulata CBS 1993 TaxID=1382522 RepID=W6MKJ4_9ASCO|nr:uncharacterized protein KUCA_T00002475001 [Kuraishia capsulata CBS 1993]CDK26503.1 unnamed protein product [Kuraishia capsulata CBS 1993]
MSSSTSSSSVSAFVTNLIVNGIVFAVFLVIFVVMKPRESRVYQPRRTVETVPEDLRADEQPPGAFAWLSALWNKPESYILEKAGPDGFFFLRYLFIFGSLSILGGFILWPLLFAINATGGGGGSGFDIISYSNVTNNKWKFLAHIFSSWIYFGIVIYTIYKELIFYISFKHSLQSTPYYDSLLSSRSMLIDNLPSNLQTEGELKALFPAATRIFFTRNYKELQKLVKERTKLAGKYEGALNTVIIKSVKMRAKALKKNKETPQPENQLSAYFTEKKLPHHRLKYPLIGEKVNTIDYGVERIGELNEEIKNDQDNYETAEKNGSAFVEFNSQLELQRAYQAVPYSKDLKLSRAVVNVGPDDIIWENLGTSFATRKVKYALAATVLTLTIIFWSIPVAFVGFISNINWLTDKLKFLKFINNMPSQLMGIITALLPTVLLAVLMMLLPPWIRKWGKVSGILTVQQLDGWTQSWFYAFQVVQVFLVATLASSASSTVSAILKDPGSAMTLLSKNLPKASNFYISYMLLKGLSVSSGALAQIVALILSKFLGRLLDKTPRKKWNRYNKLGAPSWGTTYGNYELFTVIMVCYAIIAPIIIAFTAVAFILIYIAYLYNLTYVQGHAAFDARGRHYPRALLQTFVGLYVAEVCLIGLFVMPKNWACVALEVVMLVATVAAHVYFRWKLEPLFDAVPLSAICGSAGVPYSTTYDMKDQGLKEISTEGKNFFIDRPKEEVESKPKTEEGPIHDISTEKNPFEPSASVFSDETKNATPGQIVNVPGEKDEALFRDASDEVYMSSELPISPTFFARYTKPRQILTLDFFRGRILPTSWQRTVSYDPAFLDRSFVDPAVSNEAPQIWIPRDNLGLANEQIEKAEGKVDVSDENAFIADDGVVRWTGPPPDYEEAVKQ